MTMMISMRKRVPILLALATGACGSLHDGPNATGGYAQLRADAVPYAQARSVCFEEGFGMPVDVNEDAAFRTYAFEACMNRLGWSRVR